MLRTGISVHAVCPACTTQRSSHVPCITFVSGPESREHMAIVFYPVPQTTGHASDTCLNNARTTHYAFSAGLSCTMLGCSPSTEAVCKLCCDKRFWQISIGEERLGSCSAPPHPTSCRLFGCALPPGASPLPAQPPLRTAALSPIPSQPRPSCRWVWCTRTALGSPVLCGLQVDEQVSGRVVDVFVISNHNGDTKHCRVS